MQNNRLQRLSTMLKQVGAKTDDLASPEALESATGSPGGAMLDAGLVESTVKAEMAIESLDLLLREGIEKIDRENQDALEAIVMPYYRPVVDIIKEGKMETKQLTNKWRHLGFDWRKSIIDSTFKSIGCIDLPPSSTYAGTGFVVGKSSDGRGILMTNRHVAEIFSTGIGVRDLQFRPGQAVEIDFLREYGRDNVYDKLTVEKVLMIHPFWDMALLQVVGLAEDREPLKLSVTDPANLQEREVVTIGYPGYDPTGDQSYQNLQQRIFRYIWFVKRLQPGILRTREDIKSYNRTVSAITHDCSTLGGNSGSAVLVLPKSPDEPIEVIGLHFAGAYLQANYAVATHDLAADNRVVDTGIEFSGPLPSGNDYYGTYWLSTNSERPPNSSTLVSPSKRPPNSSTSVNPNVLVQAPSSPTNQTFESSGKTATWKIPLEVSVTFGTPELISATPSAPKASVAPEEGLFGRQPKLSLAELAEAEMFSLESLAKETFDWNTSLSLAVASLLVYESQSDVEATAKNSWGLDNCKFIDVDDTQCFIAYSRNNVLISFRGTESLGDWLGNLNVFSTTKDYGVVHKGFYNGFAAVKLLLEEELKRLSPKTILITGHSLGGALATIAAAEWNKFYPITGVYTYGQPAVGKGTFSTFFSTHYSDKFFRFVNDDDIVTRVPPTYQHIGKLFHFDERGELKFRTEAMTAGENGVALEMMSEAEFDYFRAQLLAQRARQNSAPVIESVEGPALEGLLPISISDHNLSEYIRKIKAKTS